MGSTYFENYIKDEKWLDISPIDHIVKRHFVDDNYIWFRAKKGEVLCATHFTVSLKTMVNAIRLCVKAKADEIEAYCYAQYEGKAPYVAFSLPIYKNGEDGKRVAVNLGGGYRRDDARAKNRNYISTNVLRIIITRAKGPSGMPRFKVINAYPDIFYT